MSYAITALGIDTAAKKVLYHLIFLWSLRNRSFWHTPTQSGSVNALVHKPVGWINTAGLQYINCL